MQEEKKNKEYVMMGQNMINDIQGKGSSDSKSREMVSFTLFITRSTLPLKPEITSLSLHQNNFKGTLASFDPHKFFEEEFRARMDGAAAEL